MVGWHHQIDRHEFEQAPGVGHGQGHLACCGPWGHKELDTTEWLNWTWWAMYLTGTEGATDRVRVPSLELTITPWKETTRPGDLKAPCWRPDVMMLRPIPDRHCWDPAGAEGDFPLMLSGKPISRLEITAYAETPLECSFPAFPALTSLLCCGQ